MALVLAAFQEEEQRSVNSNSLISRANDWFKTAHIEEVREQLAAKTLEMACPYIYPPVSRYKDLQPQEIYSATSGLTEAALYVHIPYCIYRCHFCHFALDVVSSASAPVDAYLEKLALEVASIRAHRDGEPIRLSSIHIGGGTPSILNRRQLQRLLQIITEEFVVLPNAEFCFEVTPDTVQGEHNSKFELMRQYGVNRISIGAQVIDDQVLKSLNRLHTVSHLEEAIKVSRRCGIETINIDLMYDMPELSADAWVRTLDRAVQLAPNAITFYELRIPPESRLTRIESARSGTPDLLRSMAMIALSDAGYIRTMPNQYVSNLANIQRHYVDVRENVLPLIGIGVSALGFVGGTVFQGAHSLAEYMTRMRAGVPAYRGVKLEANEQMARYAILGLKSPRGLNLAGFEAHYGRSFVDAFGETLDFLGELGLVAIEEGYLKVTAVGSLFIDRIASLFFPPNDLQSVKQCETQHLGVYWH